MRHMPKHTIIALLLCASCASPAPGTYERGTFTNPPPAPTRPGVGLPTYDPHTKPLPPQPQPKPTRVLPETPETRRGPTIWASDVPDDLPEKPTIDGFGIPFPGNATTPEDKFLTRECSMLANGTAWVWDPLDLRLNWNKVVRKCLAAKLFKACILRIDDANRARKANGELFRDVEVWLKLTRPTAFDLERNMCAGIVMPPESDKMVGAFEDPVGELFLRPIQRVFR